MASLARDFLFALRSLGRSPVFSTVAVVSLALGIGANTAIFSLIDDVLLRTLPVRNPGELALIATRGTHVGSNSGRNVLSYPMFKDYRDKNQVFSGVMCSRVTTVNVSWAGSADFTEAELTSGDYFEVLGVGPAVGRVFSKGDETTPGADAVAVLSYSYWQTHFAADPGIAGKTLRVNGYPMTIIGVASPGYDGLVLGRNAKLFIPVTMKRQMMPAWDDLEDRRSRWLLVFGRLKSGVSLRQAEPSIRVLYKQIIGEEAKDAWFTRVSDYTRQQFLLSYAIVLPGGQGFSGMRGVLETPLQVLMGLVAMVLLIACANISNLLVARAQGRQKELAVRLALGAGRWRIVRQLFIESLMLALAGGALGLFVSYWSLRAIVLLAPTEQTRAALNVAPDLRTMFFALLISVFAAVLFGLLPALQTSKTDLVSAFKDQAGSIAGGHGARTRKILVTAQVALSLVLLAVSGLFIRSLQNLRLVDPGFKPNNLVLFVIDPLLSGYSKQRTRDFYQQLQQRLETLPGVQSAALARVGILSGDNWSSTVTVEGYQAKDGEDMNPNFNSVSPRYFKTLAMPVKAGRECDERDQIGSPKAIIVNETFAKRYFPGRSPLGYHIGFGRGPKVKPEMEIVGVAADAKYGELRDVIPRQIFTCHAQSEDAAGMVFYVRTTRASEQMFGAIRNEVRAMEPGIPVYDMHTMEDQLDRSLSIERFVAYLSSSYGALASILAVLGLYGVTAYGVARRSREIGIRMALGSEPAAVMRMVLREVLLLAAIGVGIALPLAWWLTQLVRSQLYGIELHDPSTIGLAAFALLAVALAAGAAPALRASRTDPVKVLRHE